MKKRIQWHLEKWEISKLKPYDKNPRIINQFGLNELKKSFDEIGMAQPVNINTDGTILSGHARVQQLKLEGETHVDVYIPDRQLSPKQEEAVIIRMNKVTAGSWDFEMLSKEFEIEDLKEWGFVDNDLMGIGKLEQVNTGDEEDEWVGMPEFDQKEQPLKIIIAFETEYHRAKFATENNMRFSSKNGNTWSTNVPYKQKDDMQSVKYE